MLSVQPGRDWMEGEGRSRSDEALALRVTLHVQVCLLLFTTPHPHPHTLTVQSSPSFPALPLCLPSSLLLTLASAAFSSAVPVPPPLVTSVTPKSLKPVRRKEDEVWNGKGGSGSEGNGFQVLFDLKSGEGWKPCVCLCVSSFLLYGHTGTWIHINTHICRGTATRTRRGTGQAPQACGHTQGHTRT